MKSKKSRFPAKLIALTLVLLLTATNLPFESFAKEGGAGTITNNVTIVMEYDDKTNVPISGAEVRIKGYYMGTVFILGEDYYTTDEEGESSFKQTSRDTQMSFKLPEIWRNRVELGEAIWNAKLFGTMSYKDYSAVLTEQEFRIGMPLAGTIVTTKIYLKAKKFNVSFDTDGAEETISTQEVECLRKATEPNAPTKEGYTFKGWYLGENQYSFDTPVTSDIKLVAQWQQNPQDPQEEEQEYNNTGFFVCVADDTAPHYPDNFREITEYAGRTIKTPRKLFQTKQTSWVEDDAELLNNTTYDGKSKSDFEAAAATAFTQEHAAWSNVKLEVYRLVKEGDEIHIDLKMIEGQNPGGGETGNDNGSNGGETGNDNGSNGGETGNDNGSNGGETGNDNGSNGGETGNDNGSNGGETGNDNGSNGGETGNDNGSNGGETGNDNGSNGGETGNDNGSNGGETGNDNGSNGGETGNDNGSNGGEQSDTDTTIEADEPVVPAGPANPVDEPEQDNDIEPSNAPDSNPRVEENRDDGADVETIDEDATPLGALDYENYYAYIQGDDKGRVNAEDFVTREQAATIFFRLLEPQYKESIMSIENAFIDVPVASWSNNYISTLTKGGLLSGYADGRFLPREFITRAELAALAAKFDHLSLRTSHDFVDIKGHWAEKYIASAAEKGWVRGYVNNQFRPNEFLTRAELVSFVNNVLGRSVLSKELPEGYKTFSDLHPDAWYYETILAAANSYQAAKRDNGYQIWNKILLSLNDK